MLSNSSIRCGRIIIGGIAIKSTVHRKMRRRRCITIAKKLTHHVSLFLLSLVFLQLVSIHALSKDTNRSDNSKDSSIISPYTASVIKKQTAQTKKIEHDFKVQTEKLENDIKENQLKMEHDIKENQLKIRKYWKQTFKEIKASNPVVFGEEDEEYKRLMLDRWKLFSDSGSRRVNIIDGGSSELVDTEFKQAILVDNSADIDDDDETTYKKDMLLSKAKRIPAPLRFDGFKTWEKQLQEWKDDVSMYIEKLDIEIDQAESRPSWFRALLQPKERSRYDMSTYTVSSDRLQSLTATSQTTPKLDLESLAQRAAMKVEERLEAVGEEETIQIGTDGSASSSNQQQLQSSSQPTATLYPKSNTVSPPITLTNLDPNLPSIPKPRPVTSTDAIVPHTDIADKSKNIWIVTTGALPWMTGTAVNPLLRAAYLSLGRKEEGGSVTLMLPWVEREDDQERVYGRKDRFTSPADQEQYIRTWLKDTANMPKASKELNIKWYTAWQEVLENSLYSMGDITALIPQEECDIVVLEEPEHLNWYRAPGENWISKYKHVVGIVHTNYFVYATEQPAAFIRAPGMRLLSSWMCRVHCHRIIKLSGTLQAFAPEKELIENVHGVRRSFLDIGEELRTKLASPSIDSDPIFSPNATPTVYFIGKMLWSKGLESLMDLIKYAEDSAGLKVKVDMYGGGPNKDEASEKATKMGLDMTYHGPIDHAELGSTHKVFINPSTSEVLCTTVAEALAMGKFVVLPSHPSNDFFAQFPNCLPYTNKEEFVGNLYYALTHSPEPLTKEYSYALSWEAATERFAAAGSISAAEAEVTAEALSSTEAGIDIDLPPLTANEDQRRKLTRTFRRTRGRYRYFRSRLSHEISNSKVLPKPLQQRLTAELDKRLDVDLDELLSSPKLRVKLSPAKLDKLLTDLYDSVVQGPSGDVFRVIGGGSNVGRQNLYMKQREGKPPLVADDDSSPQSTRFVEEDAGVDNMSLTTPSTDRTPTSLVQRALKRNFPQKENKRNVPKMCLSSSRQNDIIDSSWGVRLVPTCSFIQSRPPQYKYSPLI